MEYYKKTRVRNGRTYRLSATWNGRKRAIDHAAELRAKGMQAFVYKQRVGSKVKYCVYARGSATATDFYGKRWINLDGRWIRAHIYRDPQGRLYHTLGRGNRTYLKPGQVRKTRPR